MAVTFNVLISQAPEIGKEFRLARRMNAAKAFPKR